METINLTTIESVCWGDIEYEIAEGSNGKLYAHRDKSPFFCFEGTNVLELKEKVAKAFFVRA